MTRRLLLLLSFTAFAWADSSTAVVDLITRAATGLSAGTPEVFLEALDPAMPNFEKVRSAIVGLSSGADLSCSLEVWSNEGDDATRTVTLDWILRIDRKDGAVSNRRQMTVTCKLAKKGKKWQIVGFDPLDLFAPIK